MVVDLLLQALRAAGEQTRLRILALCAQHELSVTDLIQVLGQTQSRVSRHLKILVDAGLLERYQEGQWARYRLAGQGSVIPGQAANKAGISLARYILQNIDMMSPVFRRDHENLTRRIDARQERVQRFFRENAPKWEGMRENLVDQDAINAHIRKALLAKPVRHLLDVGTGTGKALLDLGPSIGAGIGIDNSFAMLDIARTNIEESNLNNCQVRHADMTQMPYEAETFDTALLNMVLHYAETPGGVIAEIARVLTRKGRLLVVDLVQHDNTEIRSTLQHLWPGFTKAEMQDWLVQAGLTVEDTAELNGGKLKVFATLAVKAG